MMPRGTFAGSATASTATGSGGETMAPKASASGSVAAGKSHITIPATAQAVTAVRKTARMRRVRQRRTNTDHEARRATAKSRGGRKSGRMISGSIVKTGTGGTNERPATKSNNSTGYGRRVISPIHTATIVTRTRDRIITRVGIRFLPLDAARANTTSDGTVNSAFFHYP